MSINYRTALLGILLGFGKKSALSFKHHSLGFEEDNYRAIEANGSNNEKIWPIGFMGDPEHEETKTLIRKYQKEHEWLNDLYNSTSDISKIILERISK